VADYLTDEELKLLNFQDVKDITAREDEMRRYNNGSRLFKPAGILANIDGIPITLHDFLHMKYTPETIEALWKEVVASRLQMSLRVRDTRIVKWDTLSLSYILGPALDVIIDATDVFSDSYDSTHLFDLCDW